MRLNSILSFGGLYERTKETVVRFPVTCAAAFLGTGSALYLARYTEDAPVTRMLIICVLCFFWSLGITLATEERWRSQREYFWSFLILFLGGYFVFLPDRLQDFYQPDIIRILVLVGVAVLGIMVAPFLRGETVNAFWHFNRKIYARLIFTFISTGVLFLGLVLSLASINYLFGLSMSGEWYVRIWILTAGLVSTTVFLVGVPHAPSKLESETLYPKVIKVFVEYILWPLIGLYTLILYVYGAKILFTHTWPEGQVSSFVLIFALVGVAATMLWYPEWRKRGLAAKWVHFFYLVLVPLMGLLFRAIDMRVSEYGWTESRALVAIVGLWLLGVGIYFSLRRNTDIRVLPVSLGIVLLLATFAPINIFSVSKQSQVDRLEKLLVSNNILVEGKIQPVDQNTFSEDSLREIKSVLDYLTNTSDMTSVNQWFGLSASDLPEQRYMRSAVFLRKMGFL